EAQRHRSHAVAKGVVDAANRGLATYFARSRWAESEHGEARNYARLLDSTCRELYFASGAGNSRTNRERPIEDNGLAVFFRETAPILERIGDYATSGTVYHLLQLLEFVLPVDPGRAFDLTAHALRNGGKRSGYQFEPLGANLLVKLVGIFLADHK